MSKDYYKILGVDKNATDDQIKTAFRKQAHLHHPDKSSGDAAKFKEANEAYQVLKDPEKRKKYDQFGSDFSQYGGAGAGGFNWSDFSRGQAGGFGAGNDANFDFSDLGDIFGDLFGSGRSSSGGRSGRSSRGHDLELNVSVTLAEAVFGIEKNISLNKKAVCRYCHGSGAEPGTKINTCKTCNGSGQVTVSQSTFFGSFRTAAVCPQCHGEGKTPEKKCTICYGSGVKEENVEIKLKIPAGVDNGTVLKMSGQGEAGEKGKNAGDLFINIKVQPSLDFKRSGDNLQKNIKITYTQAVLGAKISLNTLDGEISLKIPAGTASGQQFSLKGKGAGKLHGRGRGDLIVVVEVDVPKNITKEQKKLIEQLGKEGI